MTVKRVPFLFVLPVAMFWAGCSRTASTDGAVQAAAAKAEPALKIKTAAAESRQVDRVLALTGSLQADESVNLVFEVPGRIASINTDFGQFVRKGQVIAQLDPTEFQLQVDRAKASLAQALARVGLEPGQEGTKPESTPGIRQAKAQLEDAWQKYESAQKLLKSGDVSQQRFTEMEKAYQARVAALEAQRDELRTQMAQIQALRADVSLAQKRLNDTALRAPFDGSVSARTASPGQYVKDNATIVTLVKSWPLRLRVEVPESDAAAVRMGTTLEFTTDAAPGAVFHAVVRELNPSLDARTRTLVAEGRIVENDPRLRPGSFGQVKLAAQKGIEVTVVPREAIYSIAGLSKLFSVREGKAQEVKFVPGQEMGGWVEITNSNLKPGDRIAVNNLGSLYSGRAVDAAN